MGITASTPSNLVVGSGNLLKAQADLGASEDANAFKIEREYFTPDLNGAPGGLVGTDFIMKEEGTLESSLPEISSATLADLWPSSALGTGTGVTPWADDEIRTAGSVRVPEEAYADWELVVPGLVNEFGFFVEHAINLGSIEGSAQDDGTFKPRFKLASRWDPADLTQSPHGFRVTPLA